MIAVGKMPVVLSQVSSNNFSAFPKQCNDLSIWASSVVLETFRKGCALCSPNFWSFLSPLSTNLTPFQIVKADTRQLTLHFHSDLLVMCTACVFPWHALWLRLRLRVQVWHWVVSLSHCRALLTLMLLAQSCRAAP